MIDGVAEGGGVYAGVEQHAGGRPDVAELVGSSVVAVDTASGQPHVVLTFDDGPEPGGTDLVLSALAEARATATFFVLLSRTRRHPSLLADVVAGGHEVALHGPDHRRLTHLHPGTVAIRTADARRELEDVTGRSVRWFRPPYGAQSPATWRAVATAGLTPVMWSISCHDWRDVTDDERLEQIGAMDRPGAVVLAHDGFATLADGVDDGPRPNLDRGVFVRSLLEICTAKGLSGCSLETALQTGRALHRVWLDQTDPNHECG
ncbi:polysaccharide deacetylase family protein [Pseudonocardia xinjiangensis]|uniref:polysaccharide deacetylase family protein n=1 Tax=Pseudonocardia xinjiangensis TaxID=75289 RepID=UPI003D8FD370